MVLWYDRKNKQSKHPKKTQRGEGKMKIRFGIAGLGRIARRMVSAMASCEEAELYGVASRSLERAQAFQQEYGAVKAYGSYEEMFQDPDIDAVYLAVPNSLHVPLAMQAMAQGKAVLCEKPFAPTREEALPAVEYARDHGVLLVEAMWTRWLPAIAKVKEWMAEGKIGMPSVLSASFSFYSSVDLEEHRYHPEMGGGALLDVGCYCADLMLNLAGEQPEQVTGVLKIGSTGVDELGCLTMRFPNGMVAHGDFGIRAQTSPEAWVFGTEGKILMESFWGCRKAVCYDSEGREIDRFEDPEENGFVYELREFCQLLAEGKTESRYRSLEDTLLCAQTLDCLRM